MSGEAKKARDWFDYIDIGLRTLSLFATVAIAFVGLLLTNQQREAAAAEATRHEVDLTKQDLLAKRESAINFVFKVETFLLSDKPKEQQIGLKLLALIQSGDFRASFNPALKDDPHLLTIINALGDSVLRAAPPTASLPNGQPLPSVPQWIYLGQWEGDWKGDLPLCYSFGDSWAAHYADFEGTNCITDALTNGKIGQVNETTGDLYVRDGPGTPAKLTHVIGVLKPGQKFRLKQIRRADKNSPYLWGEIERI